MAVALNTTTTYPITINSSGSSDYKRNVVQLGDGYTQSALVGINYEQETWVLEFAPLAEAASLTLKALLLNSVNGTANILSWTPPGESTTKYWEAQGVKRAPGPGVLWKITCTLVRRYPVI